MEELAYKRYLLFILMAILASHYLDRIVLGVVMHDIQSSLALSDTQLGLLTGMGFALFYSVLGIPIARLADRGNRVLVISVAAAVWSGAVVLSAVARTFAELLLIRVVVAAAQAGCMPPAYSLLGDYFTRTERPRAAAIYMIGLPIALVTGYFAGGWLNDAYGWRMTFVLIGIPGLVLAALASITVREPRSRGDLLHRAGGPADREVAVPVDPEPSMQQVISTLLSNATFRHLCWFICAWYFCSYGLLHWQATFFIRVHGFDTAEVGAWLAAVCGGGALLGTYLGGEWGFRYARDNERLQLIGVVVMFSLFAVLAGAAYLASNPYLALGLLAVGTIVGNMCQGPVLATVQALVPPHMRATSLALLYFIGNLVGMGLGPLAAGALSDVFRPWAAENSLRFALFLFCPGHMWAAWHLWQASRTVALDMVEQREIAHG